MLLNVHSYYSLRYGTISLETLVDMLLAAGHEVAALTDINNTTGALEYFKYCTAKGLRAVLGVEFRNGNELLFIGLAKNALGFKELNDVLDKHFGA